MSEEVVGCLKSIKNISTEIKRLTAECTILRLKKKEMEEKILDYLKKNNQPGVKYGDLVVLYKESTTRKRLNKKEKEEKAVCVLKNLGVINPEEVFYSIQDSMKGEKTTRTSLQLKESKVNL